MLSAESTYRLPPERLPKKRSSRVAALLAATAVALFAVPALATDDKPARQSTAAANEWEARDVCPIDEVRQTIPVDVATAHLYPDVSVETEGARRNRELTLSMASQALSCSTGIEVAFNYLGETTLSPALTKECLDPQLIAKRDMLPADIVQETQRLFGGFERQPGRYRLVLGDFSAGDCKLPYGGMAVMNMDSAVVLDGMPDQARVVLHELGHLIWKLGHGGSLLDGGDGYTFDNYGDRDSVMGGQQIGHGLDPFNALQLAAMGVLSGDDFEFLPLLQQGQSELPGEPVTLDSLNFNGDGKKALVVGPVRQPVFLDALRQNTDWPAGLDLSYVIELSGEDVFRKPVYWDAVDFCREQGEEGVATGSLCATVQQTVLRAYMAPTATLEAIRDGSFDPDKHFTQMISLIFVYNPLDYSPDERNGTFFGDEASGVMASLEDFKASPYSDARATADITIYRDPPIS